MIQFYSPDIADLRMLPESDSRHAVRVLRMKEGDELQVIDGRGSVYTCRLVDAHPKHAAVEILSCQEQPPAWSQQLAVAVAPTKHLDRMEWLVEKMTEVGINRIIPILSERSERKEIKVERLEKIAVSAMKQSLKATLPVIEPMTPLRSLLAIMPEAQRFVAYCDPEIPRVDLAKSYRPYRDTLILIGPEGDFSPAEIRATLDAGFSPVTLGDNRLRTETAALFALSTCHVIDQLNR
ncbi:MAG: 16S rRNA (uracil(1498)-N(3))-methyltransferase [Duncaniella sp.]|nr:16S rRNA (uracil(1498)-N(3))-methyltransferase [Duncaniella sp.]MDE6860298.1 16S rRNA (uracil(1498)-N(3))-methyltransferase [Duncaniella sp.]MDE7146441.1 16S rRNA (uracil(1498)-N(3))-methyltransferase [Duncaniella sp.]